jgi:hypothetical protein
MSQSDHQCGQGSVDAAIQSRLGRKLRAVYRSVTGEPVPLEQIELLLTLRRVERERRYSGSVRAASTNPAGFSGSNPESGANPPGFCT